MTELERLTREYEELANSAARAKEALERFKAEEKEKEQYDKEMAALVKHLQCFNETHGTNYVLRENSGMKTQHTPRTNPLVSTFPITFNWINEEDN